MTRGRALRRQLRASLDERAEREADINLRPYAYPLGDRGFAVVEYECNEEARVVVAGPAKTWAPGAMVMVGSHGADPARAIVGPEPVGRRGGAAFALEFPQPGEVDALKVDSATPSTVYPGAQVVRLAGVGFRQDPVDVFEAVVFDEAEALANHDPWVADPLVEIGMATWVSATAVDVTVTVAAAAEPPTTDAPARLINVRPRRA